MGKKITSASVSCVDGLPLGPITQEVGDFVYRWVHLGTSPRTFTARKDWFHGRSLLPCKRENTYVKYSDLMLGCACGTESHTLVQKEIRPPRIVLPR